MHYYLTTAQGINQWLFLHDCFTADVFLWFQGRRTVSCWTGHVADGQWRCQEWRTSRLAVTDQDLGVKSWAYLMTKKMKLAIWSGDHGSPCEIYNNNNYYIIRVYMIHVLIMIINHNKTNPLIPVGPGSIVFFIRLNQMYTIKSINDIILFECYFQRRRQLHSYFPKESWPLVQGLPSKYTFIIIHLPWKC